MASKIHRVRYYNPKPQPINCGSFNKSNKLLAIARGDASLEIWDLNYAPFMLKCIPGVDNGSIEAIAWVNERLLSTGLGGALIEWDLNKLCEKATVLLTGHAAWCLDIDTSNTVVAVGTEQGYVNLFSVENEEIVYVRLFDKQEGRILCCKFDKTGKILVTGSIDTIRVWNAETGHATTRINVRRRGMETIVWCVGILSDKTVVSGDSHGRITFWDGVVGDQIESFVSHKSDILSLVLSEDERSLYCSGVDPLITHFVRVDMSNNNSGQWVKNVQRHIHEHDVRALILNNETVVSLGVDGYVTFSSYPPKWVMRVPPLLPAPRSSVSAKKKLLLLRYSHNLEIWKLGSYAIDKNGNPIFIDLTKTQTKKKKNSIEKDSTLDEIHKASKEILNQNNSLKIKDIPMKLASIQTKGNKQIRYCEMSPSGEFIAYSSNADFRMLRLDMDDDQNQTVSLSKVMIAGVSGPCDQIAFTEDSRTMAVYAAAAIHILHVDPEAGATLVQSVSTEKCLKSSSLLHLLISKKLSDVTYLAAADTKGAIAVWVYKTKKFEHHVNLPTYSCVPSAMCFDNENLIIAYVDQKILEYNVEQMSFTAWPGEGLHEAWRRRRSPILSITPHPQRNAVVFNDETALWVLERELKVINHEPEAKRTSFTMKTLAPFKIIPIKYIAGFHWLDDGEAVSIEILPEKIVEQLPEVTSSKPYL